MFAAPPPQKKAVTMAIHTVIIVAKKWWRVGGIVTCSITIPELYKEMLLLPTEHLGVFQAHGGVVPHLVTFDQGEWQTF